MEQATHKSKKPLLRKEVKVTLVMHGPHFWDVDLCVGWANTNCFKKYSYSFTYSTYLMVAIFEKKFITLRSWLLISLYFYFVIRIVKQEENWGHTTLLWAAITYLFSQKFQVLMSYFPQKMHEEDVSLCRAF